MIKLKLKFYHWLYNWHMARANAAFEHINDNLPRKEGTT